MPHARFRLPEDVWIFDVFSLISNEYLIGGSVCDHLHLRPGEPASFKDIDMMVGADFMESARQMHPNFEKLLESGSFPHSNFDEFGMLSSMRSSCKFGDVEYPASFWMFARNIPVDTFVGDVGEIPNTPIDAWGKRIKVVTPRHRIKMLKSMLPTKWAKTKTPSVERRIEMLGVFADPFGSL